MGHKYSKYNCRWYAKQYVAKAWIKNFGAINQYQKTSGCWYVSANASKYFAEAHSTNGPSGASGWSRTYKWWAGAGLGYEHNLEDPSFVEPIEEDGYAETSMQAKAIINNGVVRVSNIEGVLEAEKNSRYGGYFRVIIWSPNDDVVNGYEDTVITTNKVLWEATALVQDGQLYTTGGFSTSDFDISDGNVEVMLNGSTKMYNTIKVLPKQRGNNGRKFEKMIHLERDIKNILRQNNPRNIPIDVIEGIDEDNIVVTIMSHTGYGEYRDPYSADNLNSVSAKKADNESNNESIMDNSSDEMLTTLSIYPNPFKDDLTVSFSSSNTEDVSIELFSIDGRKINTIYQGATSENQNYIFKVGASELPKGIYICRFNQGTEVKTMRLVKSE